MDILTAVLVLGIAGLVFGACLGIASKFFDVKTDERVPAITEVLPGANCGGCGYAGCSALAEAIAGGKAKVNTCPVGGKASAEKIAKIMGVEAGDVNRMRAQVMCSGKGNDAVRKYVYQGYQDCVAAAKLGGGDKECAYGCIGLGTCVKKCPFGAIKIIDSVASVDYDKCNACGVCVASCPKKVIKLVPFSADVWVGCASKDKPVVTRNNCGVGCIGCKICEKTCKYGAITVTDSLALINYDKCTCCGECVEKCPRKIIWNKSAQDKEEKTAQKA
jgi:electron transport complex protein RnfB